MVAFKGLADAANGARLVVALDDVLVDLGRGQHLARGAPLDEQFKLGLLVETLHLPGRIPSVVPQPVLVAIGIEDHRALAEARLQAIRVQLGLLLSCARIPPRALGLHQRQGFAVVAPQDVVDKTFALVVGHAGDFELAVARLRKRPTSFLEQQVDESIARLGLGVVVRVGLRGRLLLGLGDLGAQTSQLGIERRLVRQHRRQLLVALAQPRFELLQLLDRLLGQGREFGQRDDIEHQPRHRLRAPRIRTRQPIPEMKQLAHGRHRVRRLDRSMTVYRLIAERIDDARLAEHGLARRGLERRLVNQGAQIVLIGQAQSRVVLVHPRHRQLQRAPRIEARRARIRIHRRLSLLRRLADIRPLGLQEGEVGHLRLLAGLS